MRIIFITNLKLVEGTQDRKYVSNYQQRVVVLSIGILQFFLQMLFELVVEVSFLFLCYYKNETQFPTLVQCCTFEKCIFKLIQCKMID